jgi:hypothetical protein
MKLPAQIVRAIAAAVEKHGGTMDDVDDLIAVWERLAVEQGARADRMRYEAANRRCTCTDGGLAESGDRCERCCGVPA